MLTDTGTVVPAAPITSTGSVIVDDGVDGEDGVDGGVVGGGVLAGIKVTVADADKPAALAVITTVCCDAIELGAV